MKNKATISINGEEVDLQLTSKEFSTGSVGFYGQGKASFGDDDKRYQISVLVVEIGSKNKSKKKKAD